MQMTLQSRSEIKSEDDHIAIIESTGVCGEIGPRIYSS